MTKSTKTDKKTKVTKVTKVTNPDAMTHDQLQAACWLKAWNHCVQHAPSVLRRFFSIPNSSMGFLGLVAAKQLEACGALAGVWDFCMYDDLGATHWIEFKTGTKGPSQDQKKFRAAMQPLGNQFFYVVYDIDTFFTIFVAIIDRNVEILNSFEYK